MPNDLEDYLFDLRGYVVIEGALTEQEVSALNTELDKLFDEQSPPDPVRKKRKGYEDFGRSIGNVIEKGEVFERLIDHPSWIEHIHRYVGNQDRAILEENSAIFRGEGQASRLHSGAHKRRQFTQIRYSNGEFRCGQVSSMIALNDWHSGDGVTMLVPGSHKSNVIHPAFGTSACDPGGSLDTVEGAVEVLMNSGDALVFVDCLAHGSGLRTNPGERRSLLYRYGPKWATYQPSDELLERLSPERRELINA
jgi:hypothetical protein